MDLKIFPISLEPPVKIDFEKLKTIRNELVRHLPLGRLNEPDRADRDASGKNTSNKWYYVFRL